DAQLDVEFAGDVLGPGKLDALVRVVADFGDVPAGIQVHHHALAGGQVTHDGVAGDRCAALGVVEHQALGAADRQRSFGGRRLFAVAGQQAPGDDVGHAVAQADDHEQGFDDCLVVFAEHHPHACRPAGVTAGL